MSDDDIYVPGPEYFHIQSLQGKIEWPKVEALCGDCLRIMPVHPTNEGTCSSCGGDTCSCPDCLTTIAKLRQGDRDFLSLGLKVAIRDWTPEDGATVDFRNREE